MTREEREDAIDIIQSMLDKYEEDECLVTEITIGDEGIKAFKMAIEALEQEPKSEWEHDHEILKAYSDGANEVLDKIRVEIEQTVSRYSISRERGGMGQIEWSDRLIKESEVLQILDKYKAESEET